MNILNEKIRQNQNKISNRKMLKINNIIQNQFKNSEQKTGEKNE